MDGNNINMHSLVIKKDAWKGLWLLHSIIPCLAAYIYTWIQALPSLLLLLHLFSVCSLRYYAKLVPGLHDCNSAIHVNPFSDAQHFWINIFAKLPYWTQWLACHCIPVASRQPSGIQRWRCWITLIISLSLRDGTTTPISLNKYNSSELLNTLL